MNFDAKYATNKCFLQKRSSENILTDKFVCYKMFVVFLEVALGVVTQSVTISRNCKQDYEFVAN